MAIKYVQAPTLYLAGSGTLVGATSITLTSLTDIYGNVLTMTNFGAKGYITLEPNTNNEESATFTGVTANANGTYTLTGVKTIIAVDPYTETSGLVRQHSGGLSVVVTDNVGFWNTFGNTKNTNTWEAVQTFNEYPQMDSVAVPPTLDVELASKKYVDDTAIAGAPDASTTTKGVTKLSVAPASATNPIAAGTNDTRIPPINTSTMTAGQVAALPGNNTDVAVGSGNKYVTQTGLQHNAEKYAADAGGTDAYAITLSPAPTSYTNGMVVYFKANTANTGAATLNVNSLGAKTIVKGVNTTLADGDIAANMFCTVIYDGTNFVLQNPIANIVSQVNYVSGATAGTANLPGTGGTQTITHNLGIIPRLITLNTTNQATVGAAGSTLSIGTATMNTGGTILSQQNSYFYQHSLTFEPNYNSGVIVTIGGNGSTQTATLSNVTSTTFDIVWVSSGAVGGTPSYTWTAQS